MCPGCWGRVWPPRGRPALLLTWALLGLTVWAVLYCVLGRVALPGTQPINIGSLQLSQQTHIGQLNPVSEC